MMYGQEGGYGSVPKKKKTGLVVGIIVFILLLVGGGFFCYKKFFARNSIEVLLDSVYSSLEMYVDNSDYDSLTGDFSVNVSFNSADNETNQMFSIFNKLDFKGNYGVDYDKNIISLDLESYYDDNDLIDMNVYTEYGRGYIYLDGLYDKYIDTPIEGYSEIFKRDSVDSKNIIVGIKKAIDASLKEEYFTIEKDSKGITKTMLDLTGENGKNFGKDFCESLLNNKVYIESYAKVFDKTEEETKEEIKELFDYDGEVDVEKYILYTKGNKFVKFEGVSIDTKLVVLNDNGTYKYECYDNDVLYFYGNVKFTIKNNNYKVLLSYYDEEEKVGFEVEVDNVTKINGKVETKDVSNSISSEEISNDDVMSIYNKLMENDGVKKIIEEVSKLTSNNEELNNGSSI